MHDCSYKDVGVGMVRANGFSYVAVILGQSPAPAAPANNAPPNNTNTGGDAKQQAEPPPEAQPPHDAIDVKFGTFGRDGLPVTVTNSSSVPGACTYDSTPFGFHKDFNVGAKTDTTFDIEGIPTLTKYDVTVQCTGQFNGATVIGTKNTTETF